MLVGRGGREVYHAGEGEARGEWIGAGANRLGLRGELRSGDLERRRRRRQVAAGAAITI